MNKTQPKKISLFKKTLIHGCFVFIAFFLFLIFIGFIQKGNYENRIYPGIYFEQENISGLSRVEFMEKFDNDTTHKSLMLNILDESIVYTVNYSEYKEKLDDIWNDAYSIGRSKYGFNNVIDAIKRYIHPYVLESNPYALVIEPETISQWESLVSLDGVFDGSLVINEYGIVETQSPRDGQYIHGDALGSVITHNIFFGGEDTIDVEIRRRSAIRNDQDLEYMADRFQELFDEVITIRHPRDDRVIELSVEDKLQIFNIQLSDALAQSFILEINEAQVQKILEGFTPQDAQAQFQKDGTVTIIPSQSGIIPDLRQTTSELKTVFLTLNKTNLVVVPIAFLQAEVTTQDLESLGIQHIISEFTTYHDCCASRVNNIHLVADKLDGHIVNPGETLSLNTFLGERKAADGFQSAGAIFEGEMVDSVGGGISQFITTFHNAAYWGGYEIVKHKPHSIYFSRYPMGIEATIDWPYLDYVFKNNTNTGVMIDTEYTDTSITVRMLGFNDNRFISGEQKGGKTLISVKNAGGKNARIVESSVSDPYNFKPPVVRYLSDSGVPRGESFVQQIGGKGWFVKVHRDVIYRSEKILTNDYPVFYRSSKDTIVRIHPCDNPEETDKPKSCF